MKTITFLNNKGGVGKTASVTSIAHMMAEEFGKKVLIIDLDPQMNATTMFRDIDFIELFECIYDGADRKPDKSVEDLLLDSSMDIHDCIYSTDYDNLDIIPSYLTLAQAEELMKADVKAPQQFRLMRHLDKIQDEYDYCLIDSSPSASIINVNGLVAADEVYIPLKCDGNSLLGVAMTMNLVKAVSEYAPNIKVGGLIFTQFNARKNVSKTVYALLEKYFGEYIVPITISSSKNIEEGSIMQMPLLAYDDGKNKNKVTQEYLKLTEYILSK